MPSNASHRREHTCTVVICTHHRPIELEKCLDAVICQDHSAFEVLVVDNAPCDESARAIAQRVNVNYIVEPTIGLSRARNLGARTSDSDIVAYLDDDALPDRQWLHELLKAFDDPLVMAAAGRVLPAGSHPEFDEVCAAVGLCQVGGDKDLLIEIRTPFWFEMANFGGVGIGANMAFRRSAFDFWEGFDERLGAGGAIPGQEEHHAFFSLIRRGYRVAYSSRAVIRHPNSLGRISEIRQRHLKQLAASSAYLTMLFCEAPQFRPIILRFVMEGVMGTPRPWRSRQRKSIQRIAPQWRRALAWLSGPFLYVKNGRAPFRSKAQTKA